MAKKTKGLSLDEKKQKLFHAMTVEASFYNFKEIESIAKKNGIVPQSVKEVLDCLIGDRLVTQEKIGSLNIFWAFASNEKAALEGQIQAATCSMESLVSQKQSLESSLASMKSEFPDLSELEVIKSTREVSDLEGKLCELQKNLTELLRSDPETIARLVREVDEQKQATNVWTDNIYILRQYICGKMNVCENFVNQMFSIPDDLDLIE